MDRVDACLESMLKNLGSLVRGAKVKAEGPTGGEDADPLLEVVASQLVDNTHELFAFITELQKSTQVGDFQQVHGRCSERQLELKEVEESVQGEVEKLREEMRSLLGELEASYHS